MAARDGDAVSRELRCRFVNCTGNSGDYRESEGFLNCVWQADEITPAMRARRTLGASLFRRFATAKLEPLIIAIRPYAHLCACIKYIHLILRRSALLSVERIFAERIPSVIYHLSRRGRGAYYVVR